MLDHHSWLTPYQPQGFQTLWGQLPRGQSVSFPGVTHTSCVDSQGVLSDHHRVSEEGALYFTKCHPVYFWYRLTREQRLGFKALYKKGCKCHVSGLLSLFSLQPRHWWLSHVLVPRALSLLSPSMDDPCPLTFFLFPGRLLPQFPSCSPPISLFPLASTCIQTLVFLGWGCEQEWVGGGNKPWISLHL